MNRPLLRLRTFVLVSTLALLLVGLPPANPAESQSPLTPSRQVERLYEAYFGRAPDGAGLNHWTQRLQGETLESISEAFAESPEFLDTYGALTNRQFVELVYRNVLDRSADEVGLNFWGTRLDQGTSRGAVMVGFSESAEFMIRVGHLDPGQMERLYRAYFLRTPDAAGLRHWHGRQAAGLSLVAISEVFAQSPEFLETYGALSNRQFVELVYRNVLDRPADQAGSDYWTGRLDQGTTRGAVMVGFSESPEFSGNPRPDAVSNIGGCGLFPADSFWYSRVDDLPVDPNSDAFVARVGASRTMHPDFGSGLYNGQPIGIPFTTVPGPGPATPVSFLYADESDPGPYPIPADAPIEGGSDRHIIVVETGRCVLHELFAAEWQGNGSISAGSGARWDLSSNAMRPDGWTSGDAAGMAILPGLVRYDEVAAGSIEHALRITIPETDNSYVWPASHQAGSNGSDRPPMGSWIRLKAEVDPDDFTGQSRVIVEALQTHGAIVADNGSSWFLSGAPDERWDNDDLRQLRAIVGEMFEFVDASSLQVEQDSMQAN